MSQISVSFEGFSPAVLIRAFSELMAFVSGFYDVTVMRKKCAARGTSRWRSPLLGLLRISSERICVITGTHSKVRHVRVPRRSAVAPMPIPTGETQLECEGLVTHLQNVAELKDTALSHELHDELGGLMGAAVMDLDALRRISLIPRRLRVLGSTLRGWFAITANGAVARARPIPIVDQVVLVIPMPSANRAIPFLEAAHELGAIAAGEHS